MEFLIILFVLVVILIVPIKIAASYVGARYSSVFMCFLAIIFAAAIQKGVSIFIPQLGQIHVSIDFLVSLLLSGIAYMMVLGTTYLKAIVIALLQFLITLLLGFIIGLIGLGTSLAI